MSSAIRRFPVVFEPQSAVRLTGDERSEEGAAHGRKDREYRNGGSDDVGDEGAAGGASKPASPMLPCPSGEVSGTRHPSYEDVFGHELACQSTHRAQSTHVYEDDTTHNHAWKSEPVGDLLQ